MTRTPGPARRVRTDGAFLVLLTVATLVTGCSVVIPSGVFPGGGSGSTSAGAGASEDDLMDDVLAEDMVLVVFALKEEFGPENLLDAMWPVEGRAMTAIEAAGLGVLDGNDVGGSEYTLYFIGVDRDAMWKLLEPIVSDAPYPLARVELWPPGSEAVPRVIRFGDE